MIDLGTPSSPADQPTQFQAHQVRHSRGNDVDPEQLWQL
jgi:hypothetical protein